MQTTVSQTESQAAMRKNSGEYEKMRLGVFYDLLSSPGMDYSNNEHFCDTPTTIISFFVEKPG